MSRYRPYSRCQPFLIPQDLQDWIPQDHLVRFVADLVGKLDLSGVRTSFRYSSFVGRPTYHPQMMVALLIYAYIVGITSSRKIEKAVEDRLDFRWLAGGEQPDHDCIATFRKKNIDVFSKLFGQVLITCQQMGMVKLGRVAVDGTKLFANASGAQTYNAAQLQKLSEKLQATARQLVEEGLRVDQEEDAEFGVGRRGDELPEGLTKAESRLKRIDEALNKLRAAARAGAAEQVKAAQDQAEQRAQDEAKTGKKGRGRKAKPKSAAQIEAELFASDKLRINLTDPDSHLMKDGATKAIIQAYNAQAVVDCDHQIIVAAEVTQEANDKQQLVPMLQKVVENLEQSPAQACADAGYFSEKAVTDSKLTGVDLLVPPSRDCTQSETDAAALEKLEPVVNIVNGQRFVRYRSEPTIAERMRAILQTPDGRAAYSDRGKTVEPVFGQIKACRGFRGFLLRGASSVQGEWKLVCLGHNILKMYRASHPEQRPAPRPRRHCVCRSVQMQMNTA
jgi:transposase